MRIAISGLRQGLVRGSAHRPHSFFRVAYMAAGLLTIHKDGLGAALGTVGVEPQKVRKMRTSSHVRFDGHFRPNGHMRAPA